MTDPTTPAPLLPSVGDGQGEAQNAADAAWFERIASQTGIETGARYRRAAAALRAAPVQQEPPTAKEITDFLCEEAWMGRWPAAPGLNTRPLAEGVAEVLAPWLAARAAPPARAAPGERERALVDAARKLHHWHDWGADNEGMVVSADVVREIWAATGAYDAPAALSSPASTPAEERNDG